MTRGDLEEAIFGSFDGMTSALGVSAGLAAGHATSGPHILLACADLAIAASVGMGAGLYLGEEHPDPRAVAVMGSATLGGSLLPALPFATGRGPVQYLACAVLSVLAGVAIGHFRGYLRTLALLAAVSALVIAFSLAAA